ncbi:MAG: hypothetical protein CMO01_09235 [Thalassobius sp.]|nr:hypothetical protein [Thalassovita sp.]
MEKYKVDIEIEAENQAEAVEKLEAFQKMTSALSHEEFIMTANFMEENPAAIAQIKAWIDNPPPILSSVKKVLFGKSA